MTKRIRQYVGLLSSILAYFLIHEGAHFLCAVILGVFKRVRFIGMGIQIDVFAEKMTSTELGIFCLVGSFATTVAAYVLVLLADRICSSRLKLTRASAYYVTIAMLLIDPLYLSALCGFFGGGDMNGISLLVPEIIARISYGMLLIVNAAMFFKLVLPKYKNSFEDDK